MRVGPVGDYNSGVFFVIYINIQFQIHYINLKMTIHLENIVLTGHAA